MSHPVVAAVAAVSQNGVVGRNGDLPWHIPEDLKFFRDKTKGAPIIMGRKTWDSLGKPLPNRKHIVVTRQPDLAVPAGVSVVATIEAALALAEREPRVGDEIYVIGGGEIWSLAMPYLRRLYITEIDVVIEDGDAFFPGWPRALPPDFKEVARREGVDASPTYRFLTFERPAGRS